MGSRRPAATIEDHKLFADYFTDYYPRVEPDAPLVREVDGVVKGYLMACRLS